MKPNFNLKDAIERFVRRRPELAEEKRNQEEEKRNQEDLQYAIRVFFEQQQEHIPKPKRSAAEMLSGGDQTEQQQEVDGAAEDTAVAAFLRASGLQEYIGVREVRHGDPGPHH